MRDCEEFYRLRDRRSVEYLGRAVNDLAPVHVAIDRVAATTAPGQLALLALANQTARVSRRISFSIPDPQVPVVIGTPFNGLTLGDALLTTVRDIDPCGHFTLSARPLGRAVSIGIGDGVGAGFDWYLGADRAIAYLQHSPANLSRTPATLRGAALMSCLGSAAVLREQLRLPVVPRILSAWNYAEENDAAPGPDSLDSLDVGRVLLVGAGAVGAALVYWLHAFGVRGDGWAVVDKDSVELHNTNRGLVFAAHHAGWPKGQPMNKASLVAALIRGATAHPCWYHESAEIAAQQFDVVLALANDHDVRERLSHRNPSVAFQATTGENWLSQLHRHIPSRDGCIWCRTGEIKTAVFGCSSGIVQQPDGLQSDAALPFLSAASGLMLATALQQLAIGELGHGIGNCWSWDFGSEHRIAMRPEARRCRDGCMLLLPPEVRSKINKATRWVSLDAL